MRTLALILATLAGCSTQVHERGVEMKDDEEFRFAQWLDSYNYLIVSPDSVDVVIDFHHRMSPYLKFDTYDGGGEWRDSEDGGQAYAALQDRLLERIQNKMLTHFGDEPPAEGEKLDYWSSQDAEFRLHVSLFWDWSAVNRQVELKCAGTKVDNELLTAIQDCLVDEHEGWCVRMNVTRTENFDELEIRDKIAVFAGAIYVPRSYAEYLSGTK